MFNFEKIIQFQTVWNILEENYSNQNLLYIWPNICLGLRFRNRLALKENFRHSGGHISENIQLRKL